MNTFHLASLALLVGLISAIPTSTYPHVDAVVPEIEFPAVEDEPKYVTTTFTIQPSKKKEFLTWIADMAKMSYTCEEGTDVYKVYEGDWRVGAAPNVANTYTIFGKFSNHAAWIHHQLNDPEGTAIYTWRNQKKEYLEGTTDVLTDDPSAAEFDALLAKGRPNAIVQPDHKDLTDPICEHYNVYNLVTFTIQDSKQKEFVKWIEPLAKKSYRCEKGTTEYSVFEGHWQVKNDEPDRTDTTQHTDDVFKNTYTIFEKFKNQAALNYHSDNLDLKGTAIYTLREERDQYLKPESLIIVSHPTTATFSELLKLGQQSTGTQFTDAIMHHKQSFVRPHVTAVHDPSCKAYPGYSPRLP